MKQKLLFIYRHNDDTTINKQHFAKLNELGVMQMAGVVIDKATFCPVVSCIVDDDNAALIEYIDQHKDIFRLEPVTN